VAKGIGGTIAPVAGSTMPPPWAAIVSGLRRQLRSGFGRMGGGASAFLALPFKTVSAAPLARDLADVLWLSCWLVTLCPETLLGMKGYAAGGANVTVLTVSCARGVPQRCVAQKTYPRACNAVEVRRV